MPVSHLSQALAEIGLIIFQLSIRIEGRRFELPWSCCAAFAGGVGLGVILWENKFKNLGIVLGMSSCDIQV